MLYRSENSLLACPEEEPPGLSDFGGLASPSVIWLPLGFVGAHTRLPSSVQHEHHGVAT